MSSGLFNLRKSEILILSLRYMRNIDRSNLYSLIAIPYVRPSAIAVSSPSAYRSSLLLKDICRFWTKWVVYSIVQSVTRSSLINIPFRLVIHIFTKSRRHYLFIHPRVRTMIKYVTVISLVWAMEVRLALCCRTISTLTSTSRAWRASRWLPVSRSGSTWTDPSFRST